MDELVTLVGSAMTLGRQDTDDEEEEHDGALGAFAPYNTGTVSFASMAISSLVQTVGDQDFTDVVKACHTHLQSVDITCPVEVTRNICVVEWQKVTSGTYISVTSSNNNVKTCTKKLAKIHSCLQFDEAKIIEIAEKMNLHLNKLLQQGHTDLAVTDTFIRTMKFHDVGFLNDMVEYTKHSKGVKKGCMDVLDQTVKQAFWSIIYQKEKAEKAAARELRSHFISADGAASE